MGRAWPLAAGIAALSLVLLPGGAAAQMYKWTDKNGNLHITDYPPPGGGKPMNLDSIHINRLESGAGGRDVPQASPPGRGADRPPAAAIAPTARTYPRVEIYGADW